MTTPCLNTFRADPLRQNCARAVLHAWFERHGPDAIAPALLAELESARPTPGRCGALVAALRLAPHRKTEIEAAFAVAAGDTRCKDLDRPDAHPCSERIAAAIDLLETEG